VWWTLQGVDIFDLNILWDDLEWFENVLDICGRCFVICVGQWKGRYASSAPWSTSKIDRQLVALKTIQCLKDSVECLAYLVYINWWTTLYLMEESEIVNVEMIIAIVNHVVCNITFCLCNVNRQCICLMVESRGQSMNWSNMSWQQSAPRPLSRMLSSCGHLDQWPVASLFWLARGWRL